MVYHANKSDIGHTRLKQKYMIKQTNCLVKETEKKRKAIAKRFALHANAKKDYLIKNSFLRLQKQLSTVVSQCSQYLLNIPYENISRLRKGTLVYNGLSGITRPWPENFKKWNLSRRRHLPAQNRFKVNNSGVFIVNFEHISHLVLEFLLLTLNM